MCCVTKLTKENLPKKVELTDSGKFIEIERDTESQNGHIEPTADQKEADKGAQVVTKEVDIKGIGTQEVKEKVIGSQDCKNEVDKPSPSQSPGKTVRIKENGAKLNGDSKDTVRFFMCFSLLI